MGALAETSILTKMNVHGVDQWSCVRWYMKNDMMPPTTNDESNCAHRRPWKVILGYLDGATFVLASRPKAMFAVIS